MTPTGGSHGKPHWTTKILSDARRRGGLAACGTRAATSDADRRPCQPPIARGLVAPWRCVPQSPQRSRLHRGPERDGRVPLAGGPIQSLARAHGRPRPPSRRRDRHARLHRCSPGGNATGINFLTSEVVAKRLGLLHDPVPTAVRIAVLINPANAPTAETTLLDIPEAARSLGLQIQILNASTSREIEAAFATLVRDRTEA